MIWAALGWTGTVLYLVNHALYTTWKGYPARAYYAANLGAAVALVISSAVIASWQPVGTNAFWAVISALALMGGDVAERVRLPQTLVIAPILTLGALSLLAGPFAFYLAMATLGWAATFLFAGAYVLLASGVIERPRFLLFNAVAAFALCPILWLDKNWPVFALEVAWGTLSLAGLLTQRRADPDLGPAEAP